MKTTAAIGIDIGGTATKGGLVSRDGRVLLRVEIPTDIDAGTKTAITVAEELLRRADDVDAEVTCIGVGAAGFVEASAGAITFSPNLVYDDPFVAAAIKARFGLPVVVDNDANVAVWGERSFGSAQGLDHVVLFTLGTGIGSGVIAGGKLLRGSTGAAAELGHTVVFADGPMCTCGLRGCLEQMASGTAIARMARQALSEGRESTILSFAGDIESVRSIHVAKAARELDELARSILAEAGRFLGIGLSNAVNVFDPDTIVLAGSVTRAGEPYLGAARDALSAATNAQRRRPQRLDATSLGADVGIVGAAALAFDEADRRPTSLGPQPESAR
ncbi:MAG TPA: ROK family protein [Actinomycetota bacterium]|jgi:glucokinase|nr:ROK family protein [Actinomycetota bacterium]